MTVTSALLELHSELDPTRIPQHIAIMMDGNRRWARRRFLPRFAGHWKGAETLSTVVKAAADLGVKVLTVYSFSTENWNRTGEEIQELMTIIRAYLKREKDRMVQEGIRLNTIGDISRFPEEVREVLQETVEATRFGDRIDLVLALNYGARDEIRRAILKIVDHISSGELEKQELSEKMISAYLDTAKWKDPELLIRPSGEARLSNFLLWQLSYTEIYITKTLWPDFSEKELVSAIQDFQKRERRLGC